jgi:hypothetical protein
MKKHHTQMEFEVLAVGDWVPGTHEVLIEASAEFLLANIEGPIIPPDQMDLETELKAGPHLFSSSLPKFADKLIASMANNHIMDFGSKVAQLTSEEIIKHEGIQSGFGTDKEISRIPATLTIKKKKVAIFSVGENQFGASTHDKPGYAEIGPWLFPAIAREKEKVDLVIVTIHAGQETAFFPSPNRLELCRSLARIGADFVLCHHPHKPQGWEVYESSFIAYGLGNFATNPNWISHEDFGNLSLAVELNLEDPTQSSVYPVVQKSVGSNKIKISISRILDPGMKSLFETLCEPINDIKMLETLWRESTIKTYNRHYKKSLRGGIASGRDLIQRAIRFTHVFRPAARIRSEITKNLFYKHLFSTQSHHELISEALSVELGLSGNQSLSYLEDYEKKLRRLWSKLGSQQL